MKRFYWKNKETMLSAVREKQTHKIAFINNF